MAGSRRQALACRPYAWETDRFHRKQMAFAFELEFLFRWTSNLDAVLTHPADSRESTVSPRCRVSLSNRILAS